MENNYQYQSPVPAPKKPKGTAAKTVALALCCSVAGGLACAGGFVLYDTFRPAGFAAVENTDNAENTGDVITEFNGEKLTSVADLNSLLNKCKEGDEIVLTVLRDGETQKIKVTLGVRQQAALPDSKSSSSSQDSPDEQDDDDQGGQNFPGYPGSGRRAPSGD